MKEIIMNSYSVADTDGLLVKMPVAEMSHAITDNVGRINMILDFASLNNELAIYQTEFIMDTVEQYILKDGVPITGTYKGTLVNEKDKSSCAFLVVIKPVGYMEVYDAYYCLNYKNDDIEVPGYKLTPIMLRGIYGSTISEGISDFPDTPVLCFEREPVSNIITGTKSIYDKTFHPFNNIIMEADNEEIYSRIRSGDISSVEDIISKYTIDNNKLSLIDNKDNLLFFNIKNKIKEYRTLCNDVTNKVINERIFDNFENIRKVQKDIKAKKKCINKLLDEINFLKQEYNKKKAEAQKYEIEHYYDGTLKYYSSVCLLIKDENDYLIEWFENYIKLGVEHFYIYDNESTIPVAEFLKDTEYLEMCDILTVAGKHKHLQHECYLDCLERYGKESRWIGFLDTDELLEFVDSEMTLPKFLKERENRYAIWFPWKVFNASGQVERVDGTQQERFTETVTEPTGLLGKIFVQPSLIYRMYVHFAFPRFEGYKCYTAFGLEYGSNELKKISNKYSKGIISDELLSVAYIKHYITRSYEEWYNKMSRGSCDPKYRKKFYNFFEYNPNMQYLLNENTLVIDQGYED